MNKTTPAKVTSIAAHIVARFKAGDDLGYLAEKADIEDSMAQEILRAYMLGFEAGRAHA